jgi:hypothetical protein
VDHLLFRCRIAKFCYRFIREAFGWKDQPVSVENLASNWLKSKFGQSHQISLSVCRIRLSAVITSK